MAGNIDRGGAVLCRALPCVGLTLFDAGQQLARPVLGPLAPNLDVVLLAFQTVATVALLIVARFLEPSKGKGPLVVTGAFLLLCALSQLVVFNGDLLGGVFPTYGGVALCGAVYGLGFVLWLWFIACTQIYATARGAVVAVFVALLSARVGTVALRLAVGLTESFVVGVACIDVSALLLGGLMVWGVVRGLLRIGPVAMRWRDQLPILLGVGLFSILFALTTQVRNNARGYSNVPEFLSFCITVAALAVFLIYAAVGKKPVRADRLFIVTIPLIAAVMVAAPLFWSSVSDVADALTKSFFNVYFAVLFAHVVKVVRSDSGRDEDPKFLRDPMVVPACALAVVWACVTVGSLTGLMFMTGIAESATAVTSAFLVATWVCVVVTMVLSRVGRTERVVEHVVPGEPAVVYVDRAVEQLRILGDEVGLSAREREVCALLVQGRSAARIGTELVLSQNTVKTHLQNIYAKAGVHTKQELLDRLAAVGLPGEDEAR